MHEGKIASIRTSLATLIERHRKSGPAALVFSSATDPELKAIREQLYKDAAFAKKFSEKYLDKKARELVQAVMVGTCDLDEELAGFINLLETYDTEQVVYVPLSGIEIQDQSHELGNVTMVQSTPELRSEVEQSLKWTLEQNPLYPDSQKEIWFGQVQPIIERCFSSPTLAKYSVVAEPIRAMERAEEETARVVEVLRFYGMTEYKSDWNVRVCLLHESSPRGKYSLCYSEEAFHSSASVSGSVTNLELSMEFVDRLRQSGAYRLLELISKDKPTGFEEKLLLATHWIANARMQYDNASKLLNLISGLEALLTRGPEYPIAITIAEGVALVLGDNLDRRRAIRDEIRAYYDKRSRLSHGGGKQVLDSDIETLTRYVSSLLLALLSRADEFAEQTDLFRWIDDQKLS